MSTPELLVVRHGQASFGTANYDRLSDRGIEQSRKLATWLCAHFPDGFPAVARGAMERHRQTLEAVEQAYAVRGVALPTPELLPELNEFDHGAVLEAFQKAQPDHEAALAYARDGARDLRTVYFYLRAGLLHWCSGALDPHLDEGWHGFSGRVVEASAKLARLAHAGSPVLVVTSGGVMAQLARVALTLEPPAAVELNLSIRNSAISEFRLTPDGIKLASWNTLPHHAAAEDRALWTHY
jgi:broad specificity phosphatase PhoE